MAFLVSEVYESDRRSRYQVMHHLEVMHSAYFNNDPNVIFFILLKKKNTIQTRVCVFSFRFNDFAKQYRRAFLKRAGKKRRVHIGLTSLATSAKSYFGR